MLIKDKIKCISLASFKYKIDRGCWGALPVADLLLEKI